MKHFCRSTVVRSAFIVSLTLAAGIGSLCAPEPAWSAQINDQTDPQTLIQTVTQQIMEEVRQQALTPDDIPRIMSIVNRDILPYVDFRRTTQYAMGRFWRSSTPQQQDQVVEQFKQLLIHTYSGALALVNTDQKFEYPPSPNDSSATDAVVRTIAPGKNGQIQIDYRLYKSPQGWRVYDINVLGAWLIQTYRTQFNGQIQQSGVDGLIQFLTDRNKQLASGGQ
ncbi:ABC transporter substrate-binding protein [Trinickia violacea]|uniref:ABC transporter substrate-binding protein n=1 Tax=Trinickia violacea TaxID=2571746 RepID=A0A4P8J3E2_9BURK|nr:ABC transporter substrate-binding protein [Trinickia violacea]QCP53029.1 ABC transporter substrate-binding protein [Trinickia violacea]